MKKINLFLIEKDLHLVSQIRSSLMPSQYQLMASCNHGPKAYAMVQRKLPDVIISGIKIDGEWDGIETMQEIRSLFRGPLIYLGQSRDSYNFERAKKTRPLDFLLKPLKEKELQIALELASLQLF